MENLTTNLIYMFSFIIIALASKQIGQLYKQAKLQLISGFLIAERQAHPYMILLGGFYVAFDSALGASIAYWIARLGGGRWLINLPTGCALIPPTSLVPKTEEAEPRRDPGELIRRVPQAAAKSAIPAGFQIFTTVVCFIRVAYI
jgi:hypothetical protein